MHIPVLLKEVIYYLNPKPGENFVDCTVGEGGHALAILEKIKPTGVVLGIDLDVKSLKKIKPRKGLILCRGNFRKLEEIVKKKKIKPVNGILFDLGLSLSQIKEGKRGFSYKSNEPLDMRIGSETEDQKNGSKPRLTAEEIINKWSFEDLYKIFKEYGEERFSRRIARKIITVRKKKPVQTTFQLKEIILQAIPFSKTKRGRGDRVLARIFQALRIAVNDELENLRQGLIQAVNILDSGGRLVVISFHSLEDRIVKKFFKEKEKQGVLKILTKKPVIPTREEIINNPKSRSAKLRAVIKV